MLFLVVIRNRSSHEPRQKPVGDDFQDVLVFGKGDLDLFQCKTLYVQDEFVQDEINFAFLLYFFFGFQFTKNVKL